MRRYYRLSKWSSEVNCFKMFLKKFCGHCQRFVRKFQVVLEILKFFHSIARFTSPLHGKRVNASLGFIFWEVGFTSTVWDNLEYFVECLWICPLP